MEQNNEIGYGSQYIKFIEDSMKNIKYLINTLYSFSAQSAQGNVPLLFRNSGFLIENISSIYNLVINEDDTLDIAVYDILISSIIKTFQKSYPL